jgi:hypothetical protein
MKKILVILLLFISVSSCKTYHTQREPQIVSVLAINSNGDTIQVSTDYLEREFRNNPGNYSNWRFQWENSWYWGNGWFNYYNPYWYNPRYYYSQRPIIIQRPRVQSTRPSRTYIPRHFEPRTPQVQPNRGRSNVQPRVQQPPSRIQQQPRTPQRTQPQRQVPPTRNGNSIPRPKTRGGVDIKQ